MTDTVLIDCKNGVRTLTLNRPHRLNALNAELLADFRDALDDALEDRETKAILLCGAGRAFCSGDDLKDFDDQSSNETEARAFIESIQDITRRIVLGDKVVIGAVHGWAVGGGLEWAINCDLAVFAENTKCLFPEIKWGMFPTGGVTSLLPRMIGLVKTRELMLLGKTFDAAEALKMGLAWKVVSDEAVFETAREAAEQIAELPEVAVRDVKRVLNRVGSVDLEDTMSLETEATLRGFLDPETTKRVIRFQNRSR